MSKPVLLATGACRTSVQIGIMGLAGTILTGLCATQIAAQPAPVDALAARCVGGTMLYVLRSRDANGGTLVSNEADRWRLSKPGKSQALNIKISPVYGKRGLPSVLVCDAAGHLIRERRGEQADQIDLRLAPSEISGRPPVLVVWNEGKTRLEYDVAVQPAEPLNTSPKHIELGDDDKERLLPETALASPTGRPFARYGFDLAEPTRVRVLVSADIIDPRVELWSGNTKIAEDEDSGGGFDALIVRDLAPGPYQLRVETTGSDEGEFKIDLSRASVRNAVDPVELHPNVPLTGQTLGPESPILDALDRTSVDMRQQVTLARGCAVATAGRPFVLYQLVGAPGQVADIAVETATIPGTSCPLLVEAGVDSPQGFISFRQSLDGILRGIEFAKSGGFLIRVSADDPSRRAFSITASIRPR